MTLAARHRAEVLELAGTALLVLLQVVLGIEGLAKALAVREAADVLVGGLLALPADELLLRLDQQVLLQRRVLLGLLVALLVQGEAGLAVPGAVDDGVLTIQGPLHAVEAHAVEPKRRLLPSSMLSTHASEILTENLIYVFDDR